METTPPLLAVTQAEEEMQGARGCLADATQQQLRGVNFQFCKNCDILIFVLLL